MKLGAPLTYGLTACILLVSAPHAEHLPLWVSALCTALLAWRTYLVWSGNPLPARWLLLTISIASVLAIAISFRSLFGREVGVTLLTLLVTLKLLELRSARDATVLIYLSCFIIITNFFYSQSIPAAVYMLATLIVILATWVHLHTGALALRPRLRIAMIMLLQAIPLSLIIFVLFPRVQGRCGACRRMPMPVAACPTAWRRAASASCRCRTPWRSASPLSTRCRCASRCTGAGRYSGISTAPPGRADAMAPSSRRN